MKLTDRSLKILDVAFIAFSSLSLGSRAVKLLCVNLNAKNDDKRMYLS